MEEHLALLRSEDLESLLVRAAQDGAAQALAVRESAEGWLDVDRAAEHLANSPAAIRALVRRRRIPFHKIEGRILFRASELDAWVTSEEAA